MQRTAQKGVANGGGPARAEEDRARRQGTSGSRQVGFFVKFLFFIFCFLFSFCVAVLEGEQREQQSSGRTSKDGGPHPDPTTGREPGQPCRRPRPNAVGRRSNWERARGYNAREYARNRKCVVY